MLSFEKVDRFLKAQILMLWLHVCVLPKYGIVLKVSLNLHYKRVQACSFLSKWTCLKIIVCAIQTSATEAEISMKQRLTRTFTVFSEVSNSSCSTTVSYRCVVHSVQCVGEWFVSFFPPQRNRNMYGMLTSGSPFGFVPVGRVPGSLSHRGFVFWMI